MASLQDIYAGILSGIQSLNVLSQNVASLRPVTGTSSTTPATPGTALFSSSLPVGFLLFQTSSGGTVKVPYYSNP